MPDDKELLAWLERELMRRLGVNRHEELRRVMEEKAKEDSWGLKLLVEEMIAFYRLKTVRKKRRVWGKGEEEQVQEQVYVV